MTAACKFPPPCSIIRQAALHFRGVKKPFSTEVSDGEKTIRAFEVGVALNKNTFSGQAFVIPSLNGSSGLFTHQPHPVQPFFPVVSDYVCVVCLHFL